MPMHERSAPARREWSAVHRAQLVRGADRDGQTFGQSYILSRQRYGPQDFCNMDLAQVAWQDLRDELLAAANKPKDVWGYVRFELGILPTARIEDGQDD
jgi:hypothetical protein